MMINRLAKKIAEKHMELRFPQQPLRLQPDYGERNAADFLGENVVQVNTGIGPLKGGPGNVKDEVIADDFEADFLADDFLGDDFEADEIEADEIEGFEIVDDIGLDRMSDFWKESRFHEGPEGKKEFEQWKKDNPEAAETFDEQTEINKDVVKNRAKAMKSDDFQELDSEQKELEEKLEEIQDEKEEIVEDAGKKAHYEIVDDMGLERMAKDHEESGSYMSRQNLREISDMADFIVDDIGMDDLDDWVEDKISHAHSAMNDVARYRGYRDDHPHGEESFKFAGRKMTPFEIVTNWFAQAEEESEGEIEYMMGVDGDDEMSGDVEILSGHDISSLIRDLERDLRWSNIEFSKSGRKTISWSLPTQSGGFEGEHFRFANDDIIDDMGITADFDKESRVKSHKHNSAKDVKDSYENQKKNFGKEWAKYEGAMTPKGINPARVQKNTGGSGGSSALDSLGPAKKPSSGGGLDALSRLAHHDDIIDDLEW
jgi:hypothetical protein